MTKVLKIDGADFSSYVDKYGYSVEQQPVYGSSVTTLDGVDHCVISRWKSYLTVSIKPLTRAMASALYDAITPSSISVQYYNPQLGLVTQSMRIEKIPMDLTIATADRDIYAGTTLTFFQN